MKPLKTKNLYIMPMTDGELEAKIAHRWQIRLRTTEEKIGSLGFCGAPDNSQVEIKCGIEQEYQGRGFGTEAVGAAVEWIFSQANVYFVTAETEPGNVAAIRILEKLEFVERSMGDARIRFEKEKPASVYLPVFICIFLSVGVSIGAAMDHMGIGGCFGMAVGAMLGAALDAGDKRKREAIKKEREDTRTKE